MVLGFAGAGAVATALGSKLAIAGFAPDLALAGGGFTATVFAATGTMAPILAGGGALAAPAFTATLGLERAFVGALWEGGTMTFVLGTGKVALTPVFGTAFAGTR